MTAWKSRVQLIATSTGQTEVTALLFWVSSICSLTNETADDLLSASLYLYDAVGPVHRSDLYLVVDLQAATTVFITRVNECANSHLHHSLYIFAYAKA